MSASVHDIVIFIGPPGAGKGSLSGLCVKELGWVSVSTGNLCRKHIADKTKIGQEIDFAIKSGKLVTDDVITDMVADWFSSVPIGGKTIILDGFPRTVAQARLFTDFLHAWQKTVRVKVVRFLVPEQIIVDRLVNRFVCQNKDCQAVYSLATGASLKPKLLGTCDECGAAIGKRKDDEYEAIRERLKVYNRHEQELIGFYNNAGQLVYDFHVTRPLHEVFEEFKCKFGVAHND